MAQILINKGDTLSSLASKNGTTVDALMAANSGNPAVKSSNLIIAGGNLNLPEKAGTPAAGPTKEYAAGALPAAGGLPTPTGTSSLGNLRVALRTALNEAGKNRMATAYSQLAPVAGGVPGTLGSVVSMIRKSAAAPVESVFNDITTSWKEDAAAAEKEKARIQELRIEYGTAIPAGVTSLDEAIKYVTPLVDEERKVRLDKLKADQVNDNNVEMWAQYLSDGGDPEKVPGVVYAAAKVRAEKITSEANVKAEQSFKDDIAYYMKDGKPFKMSDNKGQEVFGKHTYQELRDAIYSGGYARQYDFSTLTTEEQRRYIDYVDQLEREAQGQKATQQRESGDRAIRQLGNPMILNSGKVYPS